MLTALPMLRRLNRATFAHIYDAVVLERFTL
jgi:hypothetical protein